MKKLILPFRAARIFGVKKPTFYSYISSGKIPALKGFLKSDFYKETGKFVEEDVLKAKSDYEQAVFERKMKKLNKFKK